MTIIIEAVLFFNIESSVSQQARYNLKQTQTCVNDLVLNKNNKVKNIEYREVSNDELEHALKTCARDMRTTPTGDMFSFDLNSKEFIFDQSLDCYIPGGKIS